MAKRSASVQVNNDFEDFNEDDYKTRADLDVENIKKASKMKKKLKVAKKATKLKAVKKPKTKKFAVKGEFTIDAEGNVIKHTKGIAKVIKGRKDKEGEYTVTFVVRKK